MTARPNLTTPTHAVRELLIEKLGLSYDDVRTVCEEVIESVVAACEHCGGTGIEP